MVTGFYHACWYGPAKLTAVATEAEAQRCTNFRHSEGTELGDPPSQAILSDGHGIVQIYGTVPVDKQESSSSHKLFLPERLWEPTSSFANIWQHLAHTERQVTPCFGKA